MREGVSKAGMATVSQGHAGAEARAPSPSTPRSPGDSLSLQDSKRGVPCRASSPPRAGLPLPSAFAQATGSRCCFDVCGVAAVIVCLLQSWGSACGTHHCTGAECAARHGTLLALHLVKE